MCGYSYTKTVLMMKKEYAFFFYFQVNALAVLVARFAKGIVLDR